MEIPYPDIITDGNSQAVKVISMLVRESIPPERLPRGLDTYTSMWKYRISRDAYLHLLEAVNNIDWSRKETLLYDIPGYEPGTTNLARVLVLVIAEWYKRESESLDGDKAIEKVFYKTNAPSPVKIWESAAISDIFLHQQKTNKLRQAAICILGGFPLKYVVSTRRFAKLINLLADDSIDAEASSYDDLFDDHNSVFSGSLKEGSCQEFVNQMRIFLESDDDSDLPFNKSDLDCKEEEYREFRNLIRNGFSEKVRNDYFSTSFNFFTSDTDTDIQAQFNLQIGFKKDKSVIYATHFRYLGINTEDTNKVYFLIRIVSDSGDSIISQKHWYDKVGNGSQDFAGIGKPEIVVNFDLFSTADIFLEVFNAGGRLLYQKSFYPNHHYFEIFRSPQPYRWSTQKRTSADKALLLDYDFFQDFNDLIPLEKKTENPGAPHPLWSWIIQREPLRLYDVEKVPHFFESPYESLLQVSFRNDRLKNTILFNKELVSSFYDGVKSALPLLYGCVEKGGRHSLNIQVRTKDKLVDVNDYTIEYRSSDEARYNLWTEEKTPEQGFIFLRIKSKKKDIQSFQCEVFYLPAPSPIERNLSDKQILFKGIKEVCVYDVNNDTFIPVNEVYQDSVERMVDSDTVLFRIGTEGRNVEINVFRAFWLQVVEKDREEIFRGYAENTPSVPIIMRDKFSIRTIDERGSHKSERVRLPLVNYFSSGPSSISRTLIQTDSNYNLYYYKNVDICATYLSFRSSPLHWQDYIFYFWDEKVGSKPICLPVNFDSSSEVLKVDCSCVYNTNGVIFQSLRDSHPIDYYRPVYVRVGATLSVSVTPLYESRVVTFEDYKAAYDLLSEHHVYCHIFTCFAKLRRNRTYCAKLLEYALERDGYMLRPMSIKLLNRIAFETRYDWLLLPRREVLRIIRNSGDNKEKVVVSLRNLYKSSPLIKDDYGSHRYESYFFKRIFIEKNDYFEPEIRFFDIFNNPDNRRKDLPRMFVEIVGSITDTEDRLDKFMAACYNYDVYQHFFRDLFLKYYKINNGVR